MKLTNKQQIVTLLLFLLIKIVLLYDLLRCPSTTVVLVSDIAVSPRNR